MIRPNGSGLQRLFRQAAEAVSPDGRRFVTIHHRDLYLLNYDGRLIRRLTSGRAVNRDPSFSPDGKWIAFERNRANAPPGHPDIYMVRTDGTKLGRLTKSMQCTGPVFSPNGRWIAYSGFEGGTSLDSDIFALSVSHPSIRRVITSTHSGVNPGEWEPAWQPRPGTLHTGRG